MPHTSECVGSRQDRVKKVRVGLVESGLVSETVIRILVTDAFAPTI